MAPNEDDLVQVAWVGYGLVVFALVFAFWILNRAL